MSTKSSLYYSDEMHLFIESFSDNSIFLKLNKKDFKLKLEFPLLDFLKMAKTFDFKEFEKQALLTDKQIKDYCESKIEQRLKEENYFPMLGFMVYGDSSSPREEQIQKGFDYYSKKRDELRKWLDEFNKISVNRLHFGLESISDSFCKPLEDIVN